MKKYLFLLLIIISSCSKEELDDYIEPPNPNPIPQTIYSTSIQNHEWNDGWYSRDRESYPVEFFSAFEYFDYDLETILHLNYYRMFLQNHQQGFLVLIDLYIVQRTLYL